MLAPALDCLVVRARGYATRCCERGGAPPPPSAGRARRIASSVPPNIPRDGVEHPPSGGRRVCRSGGHQLRAESPAINSARPLALSRAPRAPPPCSLGGGVCAHSL